MNTFAVVAAVRCEFKALALLPARSGESALWETSGSGRSGVNSDPSVDPFGSLAGSSKYSPLPVAEA